jgi:hypothetical protein
MQAPMASVERVNMKHAASRELYAHWDDRRGHRVAPERTDIDPAAIRQTLSDTFMLALGEGNGAYPFRLAGTRVCALFGRELKDESFVGLWAAASRSAILQLLAILADESVGLVAGVTAYNGDHQQIELELLLLPLGARRPSLARAIGVLAPLKPSLWLGSSLLNALTLGSHRHIGAPQKARLLPRFITTRRRRGLVIYEGGRP